MTTTRGRDDMFEAWMREHGERAVRYCRRLLGGDAEAEDVVQESLLAVYRTTGGRPAGDSIEALMSTAMTRRCLNVLSSRWHKRVSLDDDSGPGARLRSALADGRDGSPDRAAEDRESAGRVNRAIEELPAKERVAFVLKVERTMSYSEIALEMGESADNVGVLIYRARKRLQERLGE